MKKNAANALNWWISLIGIATISGFLGSALNAPIIIMGVTAILMLLALVVPGAAAYVALNGDSLIYPLSPKYIQTVSAKLN